MTVTETETVTEPSVRVYKEVAGFGSVTVTHGDCTKSSLHLWMLAKKDVKFSSDLFEEALVYEVEGGFNATDKGLG